MKSAHMMLIVLAVCTVCVAGCEKKVEITVVNHSTVSRNIQVNDPYETFPVGVVSADGRLTTMLKLKKDDLPAPCSINAEGLATQSFTVTEDTPKKVWFHITKKGKIAGPYGKDDVHAETEQTIDVKTTVDQKTVVR